MSSNFSILRFFFASITIVFVQNSFCGPYTASVSYPERFNYYDHLDWGDGTNLYNILGYPAGFPWPYDLYKFDRKRGQFEVDGFVALVAFVDKSRKVPPAFEYVLYRLVGNGEYVLRGTYLVMDEQKVLKGGKPLSCYHSDSEGDHSFVAVEVKDNLGTILVMDGEGDGFTAEYVDKSFVDLSKCKKPPIHDFKGNNGPDIRKK